MTDRDVGAELAALFPRGDVTCTRGHEYWVTVEPEALHAAILDLRRRLGIAHLTTIVGEDLRDRFLVSSVMAGAKASHGSISAICRSSRSSTASWYVTS